MLQRVAGPDASADQVYERLVAYLSRDPPSDTELARLTVLYVRHQGSHGIEDYACTTLYACATQAFRREWEPDGRSVSMQSIASFARIVADPPHEPIAPGS